MLRLLVCPRGAGVDSCLPSCGRGDGAPLLTMASVFKRKGKRFWYCKFKSWVADPGDSRAKAAGKTGFWTQTAKSTGIPLCAPRTAALRVAEELEHLAGKLAPDVAYRANREFYQEMVRSLCLAAGLDGICREAAWKDWVAEWVAEKEEEISEGGRHGVVSAMDYWLEWLGARSSEHVSATTVEDCREYGAWLASRLAPSTFNTRVHYLRACFREAIHRGFASSNPAEAIRTQGKAGKQWKKEPFTLEEIKKLVDFSRGSEWELPIMFALGWGLRLTNSVSMRREMLIESIAGPSFFEFQPSKKGQKIRLPLVPEIAEVIGRIEHREQFYTPDLACMDAPTLNKEFDKVMEAAGVTKRWAATEPGERRFSLTSFHSFRHTSITLMRQNGVSESVSNLISHHDDPEVAKRYGNAPLEKMGKAVSLSLKTALG